jgi:hypothetical protein
MSVADHQVDVEKTAESNPNVDAGKVRETEAALAELRRAGLTRQEYEIVSPYERRQLDALRAGQQRAAVRRRHR